MTPRAAPPAPRSRTSRLVERQSEVGFEIPHQADTVGVVAPDRLALEPQGIDGAGLLRPLAQACTDFECLFLEGHGDVRPATALGPKNGERLAKATGLHVAPGIGDVVTELAGKLAVNEGRLTVGHRVAHHHVGVNRLVLLHHPGMSSLRSLLGILARAHRHA